MAGPRDLAHHRATTAAEEGRMGVIAWIVLGLIAGALARVVFPGKQPGGLIITIALGVGGP